MKEEFKLEEELTVEDIEFDIGERVFFMHKNKIAIGMIDSITISENGINLKIGLLDIETNVRKNQSLVYKTRADLRESL